MPLPLEIVVFAAGVVIVVGTVLSAVRATILPRSAQSRLSQFAMGSARAAFRLRSRRAGSYERRDRIMAMLGPAALLELLVIWLLLAVAGYTLMYMAFPGLSFTRALELSGSSIFTLGTASNPHVGASLLSYTEAAVGILILTLLITYLPSIYGAFSRRENGVALLQVRAGNPPRAATMLIRYYRITDAQLRLTELWRQWEAWFADVEESHTTFPILVLFRSPQPERSWITAAGAILDGASFWAAAIEHPRDPDVQLCIRAGFLALRRIADSFQVPYDGDPAPTDPISITRQEFDIELDEMAAAGLEVKADRDQAWEDWKGWRVNYDTVLLNLARLVEAPLTPWISDRSPVGANPRRWRRDRAGRSGSVSRLPT